jgi:hypothetical protein
MSEPSWKVVSVIGRRGKPMNALVVGLVLAAVVAADYGAFRLFDLNFFHWYVSQGPLIALAVGGVAVAVELDQEPNLVSAHPAMYVGAWLRVPGETFLSFADMVRGVDADQNSRPLDGLVTGLIGIAFLALWISWLIVIAPLQYFVNLVAGAPARCALAGRRRTWIERREDTTVIGSGPIKQMPEGAQEIGLARHPLSVTSTMTAGLLFAVSQFV